MFGPFLALLLVGIVAPIVYGRTPSNERRLVGAGLAAHVAGAFAIVIYHRHLSQYGGDMQIYERLGAELSRIVRADSRYLNEVFKLLFHRDNDLRLDLLNLDGSSSGTMCALMALLMLVIGDNLYAISIFVSLFAYVGQLAMYRAVAPRLRPAERRPVLASFMVLPSVVFWSSGFVKEAFTLGCLGLLCHGLIGLTDRRSVFAATIKVIVGVVGITLLKAYTLFPLILAIGSWVYAGRSHRNVGAGYKILGVVLAVVGIIAISRAFPEYGLEHLGTTVARQQHNFSIVGGGSATTMGDGGELDDPSGAGLSRQLKFVPLALLNSFARPFILEARNPSQLLSALEMLVVVILMINLLRTARLRVILREVTTVPHLAFASTFVLFFCLAVGLSTSNLGTLSRYRILAMPLYVGLLVALRARLAPVAANSKVAVSSTALVPRLARPMSAGAAHLARARAAAARRQSAP